MQPNAPFSQLQNYSQSIKVRRRSLQKIAETAIDGVVGAAEVAGDTVATLATYAAGGIVRYVLSALE